EVMNERFGEDNFAAVFQRLLAKRGIDMKEAFADFAAKTTVWDYKNAQSYRFVEQQGLQKMRDEVKGLKRYNYKIAQEFNHDGTKGSWVPAPFVQLPGSWAYNAYKLNVGLKAQNYRIEFTGNSLNPEYSEFQARVVIYRKDARDIYNRYQYFKFPITKAVTLGLGANHIDVKTEIGDDVYLIIAATPSNFKAPITQKYNYSYKITALPDNYVVGKLFGDGLEGAESTNNGLDFLQKSPLKIFIMAGQSNMEGYGFVEQKGVNLDQENGTLPWLLKNENYQSQFQHLIDQKGNYTKRQDVRCHFERADGSRYSDGLGVGCGAVYLTRAVTSGPEIGFGKIIGDAVEQPVLLLKTAWGGKSLAVDFRPPSSGGEVGLYYRKMIQQIDKVLDNIKGYYPEYAGQGVEVAGFVWNQGWNDVIDKNKVAEYEENLKNLVFDVRNHLKLPNLPFVIVETGNARNDAFSAAQKAITLDPRFYRNVLFVPTRKYLRSDLSPLKSQQHHWFGSFYSYYMIGEDAGKAMLQLLKIPQKSKSA
ncbi:MAG: hypothetical protein O3B09_02740, partial [Proteobacteria bacterium]|nr:hypothetical protein [Pseudomonadota bacterium]